MVIDPSVYTRGSRTGWLTYRLTLSQLVRASSQSSYFRPVVVHWQWRVSFNRYRKFYAASSLTPVVRTILFNIKRLCDSSGGFSTYAFSAGTKFWNKSRILNKTILSFTKNYLSNSIQLNSFIFFLFVCGKIHRNINHDKSSRKNIAIRLFP